jgi:thiol-disulfide isomerase/thioredoxin
MKAKYLLLALAAAAFVLPFQPLTVFERELMISPALLSSAEGNLASLEHATTWINSPPLTPAGLRGKVVLVNFLTYSCINWQRQLPYVRAWAEKYEDQGLVVVGVHTPEFAFEKDVDNIRRAIAALPAPYPIVVDSDYVIWNAFANRYWPALYFIDAKGKLRHTQFGEGEYAQSEQMIQQLLSEAGTKDVGRDVVALADAPGAQAQADWTNLQSPETYVGYDRADNFASGGAVQNASKSYAVPTDLQRNEWALGGDWTIKPQFAALNGATGRVVFRFHARDLHVVMGPAARGKPVRFRVRLDGKAPGAAHGSAIDAEGNGVLNEQDLYQLIRQPKPIADKTFEIEFLDSGAQVFVFTFG